MPVKTREVSVKRKSVAVLVALSLGLTSAMAWAEAKIGFVKSERLMREHCSNAADHLARRLADAPPLALGARR